MAHYAKHGEPDYNSKTAAGCEAAGEPVFLLRAQDHHAAETVRFWAEQVLDSTRGPDHDDIDDPGSLVHEALRIADAMERWPTRKEPD